MLKLEGSEKEEVCLEGEIFTEVVVLDGKEYEHIGFRDREGKFGDFLAENIGKKVRICFVEVDE